MKELPSREFLREWLDYDADNGSFWWKKQPLNCDRPLVGRLAGTRTSRGYIALKPGDGRVYQAHRLAWVWLHGSIPNGAYIDHIDGIPWNNAANNLRLATPRQNVQNKRRNAGTRHGLKGVKLETSTTCRGQKKWRAHIMVGGKRLSLGYHATKEDAYAAYCKAATLWFGEYARLE